MIGLHNNRIPTPFKIVSPVFKYLYNGQQFTIMSFIALFNICYFPWSEGNQVLLAIIFL